MEKTLFSKFEQAEIDGLLSRLGTLANQRKARELCELERLEASARSELAACARRRAVLLSGWAIDALESALEKLAGEQVPPPFGGES